jgi:hypothetical protein
MDNTNIFDKRTHREHLQACGNLFKSLREKHNIRFDDEDSFKESAKSFMDMLDTNFPQQSDKRRVARILEYRPSLNQFIDLQKVENNLKLATDDLKNIHHLLSSLAEGHDGLEEKLKRALWLREWLEPRKQVLNWYKYIQEAIQAFKTEIQELACTMSTGIILTIQQCTMWILLERCDEKLEKLLKTYRVKLVNNDSYIASVKDLYSGLEKEDPTSDVSTSAAASRARENIIADLEKLKTSLDGLDKKLFSQRRLVVLIKDYTWAGAAAKDTYLKQKDKDIKGYIEDLHQHSQELIPLIQRKQAGE